MSQKKKCDKCRLIKGGILTPAIMFTSQDIDHDKCDHNCANNNRPNIFISRLAVLVSLILIGALACNLYKG